MRVTPVLSDQVVIINLYPSPDIINSVPVEPKAIRAIGSINQQLNVFSNAENNKEKYNKKEKYMCKTCTWILFDIGQK